MIIWNRRFSLGDKVNELVPPSLGVVWETSAHLEYHTRPGSSHLSVRLAPPRRHERRHTIPGQACHGWMRQVRDAEQTVSDRNRNTAPSATLSLVEAVGTVGGGGAAVAALPGGKHRGAMVGRVINIQRPWTADSRQQAPSSDEGSLFLLLLSRKSTVEPHWLAIRGDLAATRVRGGKMARITKGDQEARAHILRGNPDVDSCSWLHDHKPRRTRGRPLMNQCHVHKPQAPSGLTSAPIDP
ncbi:hypothetical protein VTK26DRAFT_5842 [Humicola hyalothermophila]